MRTDLSSEEGVALASIAAYKLWTPEALSIIGALIGTDSLISKRLNELWAEMEAESIAAEDKKYPRMATDIDRVDMDASGFYITACYSEWYGDDNAVQDYFISYADFLDPDYVKKKTEARLMEEAAAKESRRLKRLTAKARKAVKEDEKAIEAEAAERAEYARLKRKYDDGW